MYIVILLMLQFFFRGQFYIDRVDRFNEMIAPTNSNDQSEWSDDKISESLKSPFYKFSNVFVEMTSSFLEENT